VGAVVSVASTMLLSRFLIERGMLLAEHGQIMIGITLVEDLAVVVLTILLPSLGSIGGGRLIALGLGLGKAMLILAPVLFAAHRLIPYLMRHVIAAGNREFFVLVALALGFATAAVTEALGLSLALGAFVAGLIVSKSNAGEQTLHMVLPLRDAFVALFFVTMGMMVNPRVLISSPSLLLVIVALTLAGKFLVWTLLVRLFRYSWKTSVMVGVGLTQIGEFSYVLVQVARDARLVGDDVYNATLAASVIMILVNGLLMKFVPARIPLKPASK
jgi:monovalent cation:H+ antiporter-2, CPA2 family